MTAQHIYIASGTGRGSGTKADPFRANSAARFDEILRGVAEGSRIHIGAGTFFTRGRGTRSAKKDFGWELRSGWTITGAGENATILRLERWPDFIASADGPDQDKKWAVMGCACDEPVRNVVIAHLTVDGNWSGLLNRPAPTETLPATTDPFVALHGIDFVHDGPVICRNLKVIGCYGKVDDRPLEFGDPPQTCFPFADLSQPGSAIGVRSSWLSSEWGSNSSPLILIDNCTLTGFAADGLEDGAL